PSTGLPEALPPALSPRSITSSPPTASTMPVILGQATVPASTTVPVFTVPPGLSNVTCYQVTQPQAVYLGTGPGVTATTGMLVPVTPFVQEAYVASGFRTTAAGGISAVGTLVSASGVTTLNVSPAAVGNCLVLAINSASADTVSAVSGGGCTWQQIAGGTDTPGNNRYLYLGTVTATGAGTI